MTSLVFETVRYVAECVRFGERELALDTVRAGDGLSADQQKAIEKIILDLGTRPLTYKEVNLAQDRIIGVVQPETWAFLQNEGLVAQVLSFIDNFGDRTLRGNELRDAVLGIVYTSHFSMNQQLLRNRLAMLREISLWWMRPHQKQVRDLKNPRKSLSRVELIPFCSQLTMLVLDEKKQGDLQKIADAIKVHCPHFEALKVRTGAENFKDLIDPFKTIIKTLIWDAQTGWCPVDAINYFQTLPHLTELTLNIWLDRDVYKQPRIFENFSRLERLKIILHKIGQYKTIINLLSKLPLKSINISDSNDLTDEDLLPFAEMTHLEEINISHTSFTYEGIKQFILAKKGPLKRIVINLSWLPFDYSPGYINRLQTEFPNIAFVNHEGKVHPQVREIL